MHWIGVQGAGNEIASRSFVCGFCGNRVASDLGWNARPLGAIRICPECSGPTFFDLNSAGQPQTPGVSYGNPVNHLPGDIDQLYQEARSAIAASSPTAAVLCCRKILMHVAVERGAAEGENFVAYVKYLEDNNFIPAGAKAWVDQIRVKGNETNHEIQIKTRPEAEEMIDFTEMLLKVIYDYPSRVLNK
jgi:hypothetical protein